MKQVFKHFLIITVLLFVALGAAAQGNANVIKKIEGVDVGNQASPGDVIYEDGTITVTPDNGYYLTAEDITVYKMINGQYAQGRKKEPAYNTQVAITASDPDADPSKATTYTFTKPGDEYDYEITANFHVRTSVENATVTGLEESYTYTGEAIKPVVTVKVDNNTLTLDTDYRAFYNDSINASTDQVKGKITLYGIRKYTGTKQIEYTIVKADPTLTFSSATATYTFGQEFTKPTLTTTPAGLAVTYASSNDNVAKVDEASGDITPVAVSTEAITITASFAGNGNYNAKDATYALTVAKGTAVVTKAPTAKANLTYTGEALALINAGECTTGNMQYKVGTNGTYSANIPTGTDAKTYTVYYKDAGNSNYNASDEASVTVTIGKAAGTISYAIASVSKTFGDDPFINDLTITGDGIVSYSSRNEDVATVVATTGMVTIKASGEAYIEATVADKDGGNYTYETNTASYLLSIDTEAMEVSAIAYTGTYDGEAHTITMTAPKDAVVKYGTTEGNYNLDACPTYTNAGTYTVFYQVTKPNYTTVAGSQTVTINKAAGSISFAIASVSKTFGDDPFINDMTITGDGIVSYSSLNEDVATVNATTGMVTIKASGEAYIEATVADKDGGNYTYATKTATYTLTVEEAIEPEPQPEQDKYALWIGTDGNMTKVTAENADDILGDGEKDATTGEVSKSGSIIFYPDNHTLFIAYEGDENAEDLSIESRLPILTIYIRDRCNSKLKRIYYNNAEGTEAGTLEFTGEYPTKGKLFLENEENESAIFGFSNVTFDENSKLAVIEPDGAKYGSGDLIESHNPQIQQMCWSKTEIIDEELGEVNYRFLPANKMTISAPLEKANEVVFDRMSFTQKDKNGNPLYDESGDPIMIDMTNGIVGIKGKGEALVTLPLSNDPNSDEGPDNSDGIWGLAVQSTMTDAEALDVAKKVAEGNLTPSGSQFANLYKGQTILVPEGEGVITVKAVWEEGYEFHLLIGESEDGLARFAEGDANILEIKPILGGWTEGGDVYMNVYIKYDMPAPTYCYLYLVKIDKASGARNIIPIGKREKAHGKVVSINVNIVKKAPGNPASEISGGAIPKSEDIIKDDDIITGIKVINNTDHSRVGNNKWYNLNGQQIDLPTKQGLYIINGKKIIIK